VQVQWALWFELAKVNHMVGTYNLHTFMNYKSSKDNQR